MRAAYQGWLDSGLTCRKRWLQPMPKVAMTHSNANISSPQSVTSNIAQSPPRQFDLNTRLTRLTKTQHPNQTNLGYSNRVRVHAAHNREHDCHDRFTLYRACTHSP
jgi:hypothetical protein